MATNVEIGGVEPGAVSESTNSKGRMKSIVVARPGEKGKATCRPPAKANCLTRLFFGDMSSLINTASKRKLEMDDLYGCPKSAEEVTERFGQLWEDELKKSKKPKIRRAMMRLVKGLLIPGLVLQGISIVLQFAGPILINQVLKLIIYRQEGPRGLCNLPVFPATLRGPFPPMLSFASEEYLCKDNANYYLCAAILTTLVLGSFCQNHGQLKFQQAALEVRGAMIGSVYRKTLKLSSLGMSKVGAGKINNIAANDTENLLVSAPVLSMVFFAPFQIIFSFVLLGYTVGATVIAGFGVIFLVLAVALATARKSFKYKAQQFKFQDQRIKLTNELLNAARIVKAYGWERPFELSVMKLRNPELHTIRMQGLYFSVIGIVIIVAPVYLGVATFSTYAAVGNTLTPDIIFTALAVLNLMRFPLAFLPFGIVQLVTISLSFMRMQELLTADELQINGRADCENTEMQQEALTKASTMDDVEFGYHYEKPVEAEVGKGKGKGGCLAKCMPKKGKGKGKGKGKDDGKGAIEVDASRLVDVTKESGAVVTMCRVLTMKRFQPTPGGLTMIVGPVGSGKSTLLQALLGELEVIKGNAVDLTCQVAYAAQMPWIINATVEGNIRFAGLDYGREWYDTVMDKCCLLSDLDVLPGGDQTEIGERGVNLSGGQKARIALARAVYSKAKMYLFDDPLAAVDPHVGKQLVDGICSSKGILAGTTRVLVTHQVQFLPMADQIVVLDQGNITACGTYAELMESGMVLEQLERQVSGQSGVGGEGKEEANADARKPIVGAMGAVPAAEKAGQLVEAETTNEGKVTGAVYSAVAFKYWGAPAALSWLFTLVLCTAVRVSTDLWLAVWVDEGDPYGISLAGCIAVYATFAFLQGVMVFLRVSTASVWGWIRACRLIYMDLLHSVFLSPTVFFDTTPSGRILNRFTADMDVLDSQIPRQWSQTAACLESVLTVIAAIVISEPLVGLVILPAGVCYYLLANYYRHIARDVQRIEGVSKTPIFSRFSETLAGVATARAFGYQNYLTAESMHDINNNQAANWMKIKASAWLALRLEAMSCIVTTACALFPTMDFKRDSSNAALVGVALTYGLELSRFIQALTKFGADLEQKFTSVERILEYTKLPTEAPRVMDVDKTLPASWPAGGSIEYRAVTMRYRPGLEPALRGLSFMLKAGEKLGVVGRTGSGKSSITVSLLRLTECEEGTILIDGENIRNMGLQKLRTSVSLIPQEPVLFGNMSLRKNLDPFDEFPDEAVKNALVQTQMDTKESLKEGLATVVSEGGSCFSVGERQLLCLARAMLRGSKITLLDEATASVDNDTDDLIQRMIRESFKASTVMTIAHRIRTILDADKILVMNTGVCEEFGPPEELLNKKTSYFRESCEKSGITVPLLGEAGNEEV